MARRAAIPVVRLRSPRGVVRAPRLVQPRAAARPTGRARSAALLLGPAGRPARAGAVPRVREHPGRDLHHPAAGPAPRRAGSGPGRQPSSARRCLLVFPAFFDQGPTILTPPPFVHAIAGVLVIGGTAFGVWGLLYLRHSFSIIPEARRLVVGGPYRIVRHPLYFAEISDRDRPRAPGRPPSVVDTDPGAVRLPPGGPLPVRGAAAPGRLPGVRGLRAADARADSGPSLTACVGRFAHFR